MNTNNYIELYHGTTSLSAFKIFESGAIKPKNATHSNNEAILTTTSQFNKVYLTRKKQSAVSYGYDRTDDRGWTVKNDKLLLPVVFTILINTQTDPLYIDEDYLVDDIGSEWSKFLLNNKIISDKSQARNWTYYHENNPQLADKIIKQFNWKDSLSKSGSITFEGNISLNRIKYVDIYFNPKEYIRLTSISFQSLLEAYRKCCSIIMNKYITKYLDELEDTSQLPNPYKYELLNCKNNKLDGTIYKNINLNTLDKLNHFSEKYNYSQFNKILITQTGVYYMQHISYIKYADNINQSFDTKKYVILDISNNDNLVISYFTYIRNNVGLIIKNKELINKLGNNKKIIFEMKYHNINYYNRLRDFWEYIDNVINKKIIVPAKIKR